jgi:hypothetical protein
VETERVVDVWFPQPKDGFGSGYLLTDRLVLTSKHISERDQGLPFRCKISPLADETDLRDAKLIWESSSLDAALIAIEPQHAFTTLVSEPPTLGVVEPVLGRYACESCGFPRSEKREKRRNELQLKGHADFMMRERALRVIPADLHPQRAPDWSGYSGAPIFIRRTLVGIVQHVPEAYDAKTVEAVLLNGLLDDAAFLAHLAEYGGQLARRTIRSRGFYQRFAEDVPGLAPFVDRTRQVLTLQKHLASYPGETKGCGFVVAGARDDQPDLLVQRMAQEPALKALLGDASPDKVLARLTWPQVGVIPDPEPHFARLLEACAKSLSLTAAAGETEAAFMSEVALGEQPLGLWWVVDGRQAPAGHASLLDRWLGFCRKVAANSPPFIWLCCIIPPNPDGGGNFFIFDKPDPELQAVVNRHIDELQVISLGQLAPVVPGDDLEPWFVEIAKLRPRLGPDATSDLHHVIRTGLTGRAEWPLAAFVDRVTTILNEAM